MKSTSPWRNWAAFALIAAVVLAVFGQVTHFDWVSWDDDQLVYANPLYNPLTAEKIALVWRGAYLDLYTPLTYSAWAGLALLSWQPQIHLAPAGAPTHLTPGTFHAANLLLHLGCALLAFALLRRLIDEGGKFPKAALCGVLFFALHPIQAEAVAWISELKGMLSSFFVLAARWQFVVSLQSEKRARLHAGCAVFLFLLALLSKPAAVPAPLMALLLGRLASEFSWRELARRLWGWWILAVGFAVVAKLSQPAANIQVPLLHRPFIAGDALAFYLAKLAWPLQLAPHYGRTPDRLMAHGWAWFSWLIPAALALVLFKSKRRWLLLPMALFAVPLLPVLGLVPFRFQGYSTVSDRYVYLALLGPAFIVAKLLANRPRSYPAFGVALTLMAVLAFRQTATWADSKTLFDHTVKVNPQSWMALHNLGVLVDTDGDTQLAGQLFEEALKYNPHSKEALNNLGFLLVSRHDLDGAEKFIRRSLEEDPDYGIAWANLGSVMMEQNKPEKALGYYQKAVALMPLVADPHSNLGVTLTKLRQPQNAIAEFQKALALQPESSETLYNLGLAQVQLREVLAARQSFEQAAKIQPDYWEARHAVGLTFWMQGDHAAAVKVWKALLTENPSYAPAAGAVAAAEKMNR